MIDQRELIRDVCHISFFEFLKEFWGVIVPERAVWNWHIKYLCDTLQDMAERVFRGEPKNFDLIVNVPPGQTKSTIFSIAFPIWTWLRMPTARHICASHAYDLGMDLSRKSRDIVETEDRKHGRPSFRECFPKIRLREDQNTKGYFMNTLGGSRKSVTVGGKSPVGFHAHFLIVDDAINPKKAASDVELANANQWMTNELPSRVVDLQLVPIILVMQRLHQDDPAGHLLAMKSDNVRLICLPACSREFDVVPRRLRALYQDGLLDPVRLPREVLDEIKHRRGAYVYAGQYGQSPIPRGGGMFKTDRIQIDVPNNRRLTKHVRFWDKAGTAGGGAFTVGVLIALDAEKRTWVLDVIRGQWDSAEREQIIRMTAEIDGTDVTIGLEQEPGSGGKESAQATVRRLAGFRVKIDRPTGDKASRADPFSTQVNAGNVLLQRAEWNREYIEELRYFPNSTYKDQVDATSGAYTILSKTKLVVGAF